MMKEPTDLLEDIQPVSVRADLLQEIMDKSAQENVIPMPVVIGIAAMLLVVFSLEFQFNRPQHQEQLSQHQSSWVPLSNNNLYE
ncbi:MAG: hypothetical protein P8H59_08395 [Flavobacteriales bacterium]|nr:hypothetical protein [Flavobacteriales bacterium]